MILFYFYFAHNRKYRGTAVYQQLHFKSFKIPTIYESGCFHIFPFVPSILAFDFVIFDNSTFVIHLPHQIASFYQASSYEYFTYSTPPILGHALLFSVTDLNFYAFRFLFFYD